MIREICLDQSGEIGDRQEVSLPDFQQGLEFAMSSGKSLQVDGTNVVRVPFGVRHSQKKRPERPQRWVTLVLPFNPIGTPTPPPQAA